MSPIFCVSVSMQLKNLSAHSVSVCFDYEQMERRERGYD